jgi:hypothetical protein
MVVACCERSKRTRTRRTCKVTDMLLSKKRSNKIVQGVLHVA